MSEPSLEIECEKCKHKTPLYDLVQAARVLELHPESLRRNIRYVRNGGGVGKGGTIGIKAKNIERGLYFYEKDIREEMEAVVTGQEKL